ncbi:MAG: YaaC family protein [Candidatus Methylumidiphilus sp.]
MNNEMLSDCVHIAPVVNGEQVLRMDMNYLDMKNIQTEATSEWASLSENEQDKFNKNIKRFFASKGIQDSESAEFLAAKNYALIKKECDERLNKQNYIETLPVGRLYFDQSLLDLVSNIENTAHLKELYRLRKRTTGNSKNAGINSDEANRLKSCIRQGRELYISGKQGSLLVKPLNFFYSLTAYSYAIIILNNPIRYMVENLPGSHGLDYDPSDYKVKFGGNCAKGTFSELVFSSPTLLAKNKSLELAQDNLETLVQFFKQKNTSSLGVLLSMVPEIREYYKLITGKHSRTYPMDIELGKDTRNMTWKFLIGDGEVTPNQECVAKAFSGFTVDNRYGKKVIEVPVSSLHKITAMIFVDADGALWYVENPFYPVVLSEICLHFMLTYAFSNIMRYSPHLWGNILLNEGNSDVSLITRKYLSAFENKFPLLILRNVSKFYPVVA